MSDKLNIRNEMAQFDRKNRCFYDELTAEEQKKFSNYLMIRWGSAVQANRDFQEWYLIATNERLNKHFFEINQHPKLQWLCATTVSPGMGTLKHQWIPNKKKDKGSSKVKRALMSMYPTLKQSDIETLSHFVTEREIREIERNSGNTD